MPGPAISTPHPKDWQEFQRWCRQVYSTKWNTDVQLHGRSGQKDRGVDFYGKTEEGWLGGQAKKHKVGEPLTREDVTKSVEDALEFKPKIKRLIIATTAERDVATQQLARQLSDEHEKKGLFSVTIDYYDVFEEHFRYVPQDAITLGVYGAAFDLAVQYGVKQALAGQSGIQPVLLIDLGKSVDGKLKDAQELIKEGQPQAARTILERIDVTTWLEQPAEQALKNFHRLAELGLIAGSVTWLEKQLRKPRAKYGTTAKTVGLLAIAARLRGRPSLSRKLSDKAIDLGSEDNHVISYRIATSRSLDDVNAVEARLSDAARNSAEVLVALAIYRGGQQEFTKALDDVQKAIEREPDWPVAHTASGEIRRGLAVLASKNALPTDITDLTPQQVFREAIEAFDRAAELAKGTYSYLLPWILSGRARTKRIHGDIKGYEADLAAAKKADPEDAMVLFMETQDALYNYNAKRAIERANRLLAQPGWKPDYSEELALTALMVSNKPEHLAEVVERSERLLRQNDAPYHTVAVLHMQLQALLRLGKTSEASQVMSKPAAAELDYVQKSLLAAEIVLHEGDTGQARTLLNPLVSKLLEPTSRHWIDAVPSLRGAGMHSEVVQVLKSRVSVYSGPEELDWYFDSAQKSNSYQEAFEFANQLIGAKINIPKANELFAYVASVYLTDEAPELLIKLANAFPNTPDYRIVCGYYGAVLHNDELMQFATEVEQDPSALNSQLATTHARTLARIGEAGKALDFAYKHWRKNRKSTLAAMTLFGIASGLQTTEKPELDALMVGEQTAFEYGPAGHENDKSIAYIEGEDADSAYAEIKTTSKLYQLVRGLKVSNKFTLPGTPGVFGEVRKVFDKRVKRGYAVFEHWRELFPDDSTVQTIPDPIGKEGKPFENQAGRAFLSMLRRRRDAVQETLEKYFTTPISLNTLAELFGLNSFTAQLVLASPNVGVRAYAPGENPDRVNLDDYKQVVLDSSSAASIFLLDPKHVPKKLADKLLVTRPVLWDVQYHLEDQNRKASRLPSDESGSMSSLSSDGHQLSVSVHEADAVSESIQRTKAFLAWLEERQSLKNARNLLQMPTKDRNELENMVGVGSATAIAHAKSSNGLFLTDDPVARVLARKHGVAVAGLETVLRLLKDAGEFRGEPKHALTEKFVLCEPPRPRDVYDALRNASWRLEEVTFKCFTACISFRALPDVSAINLSSELLILFWQDDVPNADKLTDDVATALKSRGMRQSIRDEFLKHLHQQAAHVNRAQPLLHNVKVALQLSQALEVERIPPLSRIIIP